MLGQYLDPIADKLLLSTISWCLAILHKIAWKFTVMRHSAATSRSCAASAVSMRDCRASRLSAQHFWQGEHICPGGPLFLCFPDADSAGAWDWPSLGSRFLRATSYLHHYFRLALRPAWSDRRMHANKSRRQPLRARFDRFLHAPLELRILLTVLPPLWRCAYSTRCPPRSRSFVRSQDNKSACTPAAHRL